MAFMRDPGFPDLMHYTARMSYLMSQGRPAAEVALLLPSESLWMGDTKADDTFVSTERLLSEHQIDFDIVGEDAVASELKAEPGAFVTASGNRYRTVLVPDANLLPGAVVERLKTFAAGGGHVVFLGQSPSFVSVNNDLHARAATPTDFAWSTVLPVDLPPVPTPPAQPPTAAPAPMIVADEVIAKLRAAMPAEALRLTVPNTSLRYMHRELKDATVFLLFNESAAPLQDEITLRARGAHVEVWDPQTGNVTPVEQLKPNRGKRELRVPLQLAPYAAEVFVVR